MRAAASLPALVYPSTDLTYPPTVLVSGVPEPRLRVLVWSATAPFDQRTAELRAVEARPSDIRAWCEQDVELVRFEQLIDGEALETQLLQGRLSQIESNDRALTFELTGTWSGLLQRPITEIWRLDAEGQIEAVRSGVMLPGSVGNRSVDPIEVAGLSTHVLQDGGLPWTTEHALRAVFAWVGRPVELHELPDAIRDADLTGRIRLDRLLAQVLDDLMSPYNLVLKRGEIFSVRARSTSRRVALPIESEPGASHAIRESLSKAEPAKSQRWIARAEPAVIESTFELQPDWDPTLGSLAPTEYGQSTSTDFARVRDVYRRWSLNEDARLSGPAFDLAAFFEDPTLTATPLRFGASLIIEQSGARRPAIVEMSLDGGQNWSQYPLEHDLLRDNAGVWLGGDLLPPGFLSAGFNDLARVRVTATLTSPAPVTAHRWRGNPFAGVGPERVFDLSETYAYRDVHPASLHAPGLASGAFQADTRGDRAVMQRWLVERMRLEDAASPDTGRVTLELTGAYDWLRPGDRLDLPGLDTRPPTPAQLDAVRCRYHPGRGVHTDLTLRTLEA